MYLKKLAWVFRTKKLCVKLDRTFYKLRVSIIKKFKFVIFLFSCLLAAYHLSSNLASRRHFWNFFHYVRFFDFLEYLPTFFFHFLVYDFSHAAQVQIMASGSADGAEVLKYVKDFIFLFNFSTLKEVFCLTHLPGFYPT